jgi:hypothetical protein
MSIFSRVLSAAGTQRRPWVLAVMTLVLFGATEALGVGLYYSVERARLYNWAHSESVVPCALWTPDTEPCPNRMQPPSCLASQAPATESAPDASPSDSEIVLNLLEVRNAGRFILATERPVQPENDPETTDMP